MYFMKCQVQQQSKEESKRQMLSCQNVPGRITPIYNLNANTNEKGRTNTKCWQNMNAEA